jgi:diguanylate cyclase (GGDEF)-like protein/PAS domain S-box-containing protein
MERKRSMNLKHRLPLMAVTFTSVLCIAISIFSLKAGIFIVFQNLFYFPIIISCFYYRKKGFAISVALSCIYFFLIIAFTSDPMIIRDAVIRVIIFIFIAAVVTALAIALARAEEALRESQDRYRTLVETTRDLIYTTDRKGFLTYMNPILERTLMYAPHEWNGKTFAQIVAPECIDSVKDLFKRAMKEGESLPVYETNLMRKDGVRFSVEFNVVTIYDSDGKPSGRYGIGRDVTDRKRADEALRESETLQRTLLANLPTGVIIIDPVTRMIENVNITAAAMFGVQAEHIVGNRCHAFLCPASEGACPVCDLGKEVDNAEREMVCADGSRRPVLKSVKRVQIRGQEKLLECFVDITAQKRVEDALEKSQERYRTLVENASDIIFKTDVNGNFTFVNPALINITGYEEAEIIGRQYTIFIRPDMRDIALKFFGRQLVKGLQNTYSEYPILTKDGHEVWVGQNAQLIVEDGNVTGFQVVARDITERKRMEAEILALSITDQLTGLHNRRGFLSLAGQQLKLSDRNKRGVQLYFADLDGLKWINDTLGHEEGDKALIEAATIFKETFRTSDIIARLGGDEYAALAVDITETNFEIFAARLQSLADTRNRQENRRYRLSISVGCSYYDPENPCSLDELIASADRLMYEHKQRKKGTLPQKTSLSSSIH